MTAPTMTTFDEAQVRAFLALVMDPAAGVTELAALHATLRGTAVIPANHPAATVAGWFDKPTHLLAAASHGRGVSWYVVANPLAPEWLARGDNRLINTKARAADAHARFHRWLLIDVDPARPVPDISATDAERDLALGTRDQMLADLPELAAASIWGCSGNGGWILARLPDLPNAPESYDLVRRTLAALAARYGDKRRGDPVDIDPKTCNAARLMPLPGTLKCKGENRPDRPHRLATLDSQAGRPDGWAPTPIDLAALLDGIEERPGPPPAAVAAAHGHANGNGHANGHAHAGPEDAILARADAYLAAIPGAVSGQRGHDRTFAVACVLVKGFGLSVDVARGPFQRWNTSCVPPWSDHELEHKLHEADRVRDDRPRGWLRDARPAANGHPYGEGIAFVEAMLAGMAPAAAPGPADGPEPDPIEFRNFAVEQTIDADGAPKTKKVPLRGPAIAADLLNRTGGWPKCVGVESTLFVPGESGPRYLNSPAQLLSWIDARLLVNWAKGDALVGQERFYEHLRASAEWHESVEVLPHWPPLPATCYLHDPVAPGDGTALERLLDRFAPLTPVDRELIRAFLLTPFWGGTPGSRPAFLVTGPGDDPHGGRGIGKTKLTDALGWLLGGYVDVSPTDDIAGVKTRLLSDGARNVRLARLDNVKSHKFSWADLEGLITATRISGKSLYKGEGQRPNTLTWAITLNGASLSKDMAQRVVVVKLARPEFRADWEESLRATIVAGRAELLADIRAAIESHPAPLRPATRWASWEAAILARTADPLGCQEAVRARQDEIDADDEESAAVAELFRNYLMTQGHDPDQAHVWIPSATVAAWVAEATGQKRASQQATAFLRGLGIPELSPHRAPGGARGWRWMGRGTEERKATPLSQDDPSCDGACDACDGACDDALEAEPYVP